MMKSSFRPSTSTSLLFTTALIKKRMTFPTTNPIDVFLLEAVTAMQEHFNAQQIPVDVCCPHFTSHPFQLFRADKSIDNDAVTAALQLLNGPAPTPKIDESAVGEVPSDLTTGLTKYGGRLTVDDRRTLDSMVTPVIVMPVEQGTVFSLGYCTLPGDPLSVCDSSALMAELETRTERLLALMMTMRDLHPSLASPAVLDMQVRYSIPRGVR